MTQPLSLSGILPTRNPWRGWSAATQDDPNADRQGWQSLDVPKDMPFSLSGSQQPEQPRDTPPPYATSTFPERNVAALDGLSLPFLTGQPAPQQPAFNDALGAASAREDERFRNLNTLRGPSPTGISDEDAGQTLNYMGVSGAVTPQQWTQPEKAPYDYYQGNLESGRNISRSDIPAAYDAQKLAEGANATNAGFGAPGQDVSSGAFVDQPRSVTQAKDREISDFGRNLAVAAVGGESPIIARLMASYGLGEGLKTATEEGQKGNYANAGINAAGGLLNAFGFMPKGGLGSRFAEEAAAANLGKRLPILDSEGNQVYRTAMPWETREDIMDAGGRVKMNADGTPSTRLASTADPTNPFNFPRETPNMELPADRAPSTALNSLVGYTPEYAKQVKRKIGDAIEDHLAETSRIEATMDGPARETALRAADAKFNEVAYGTRTTRQPMQGPPAPPNQAPAQMAPAPAPEPQPKPQDNPFPRGAPPKRRLTPDGPAEAPGLTRGMTPKESAAFRRAYWRNQNRNNSTSE